MARFWASAVLFIAAAAAQPAMATSPVTVTPHNPVDPAVIAQDKAAIAAEKLIFQSDPKGSAARQQARILLDADKLQLALDQQALGVPGPVEGVGLPFILAAAMGGVLISSRRRRLAGAVNGSAPAR